MLHIQPTGSQLLPVLSSSVTASLNPLEQYFLELQSNLIPFKKTGTRRRTARMSVLLHNRRRKLLRKKHPILGDPETRTFTRE